MQVTRTNTTTIHASDNDTHAQIEIVIDHDANTVRAWIGDGDYDTQHIAIPATVARQLFAAVLAHLPE